MRLKQIKLSGFKSFVDPTLLYLNAPLIAIVGPNGCGKSNIIDAIRWVLGESSAKDLRGESMVDVIFNGSSNRKPVGFASIELLFDNLSGKLNKEYANFAEVSVRREIDRNKQSEYYLNDHKCRKRDITDLFAGTGLLQNGYAIISQGTVSKIIESRPEELRGFIEEAADIAIYKKRRHETELRMQHTEENLTRIQDLIIEQDRLLEKLEKQQAVAQQYQQYQLEKQTCETKLLSIKSYQFNQQIISYDQDIKQISLELEQYLAKKANINLQLEQQKIVQTDQYDNFSKVQEQYFGLNTSIATLEQTLQYKTEQQHNWQNDLAALDIEINKLQTQYDQDHVLQEKLNQEIIDIHNKYRETEQIKLNAEEKYNKAQADIHTWHTNFNASHTKFLEAHNKTEKIKFSIEQLQNLSKELGSRIDKLTQEHGSYNQDELTTEILLLEKQLKQQETEQKNIQGSLLETMELLNTRKKTIKNLLDNKHQLQSKLHELQGNISAIKILQGDTLAMNVAKTTWLDKANISAERLFFQQLDIETGWETAVSVALNSYLDAILVANYSAINQQLLADIANFKLTVIETDAKKNLFNNSNLGSASNINKISILSKISDIVNNNINNSCIIESLLEKVYVQEDLDSALAARNELLPGECFITKIGEIVGYNWLCIDKIDPKHQIISRNKQLQQYELNLQNLAMELSELETQINTKEQEIINIEQHTTVMNANIKDLEVNIRNLIAQISAKKVRLDNIKQRVIKITSELKEYQNKLQELSAKEISLRTELAIAIEDSATYNEQKNILLTEKPVLQQTLEQNLTANKVASNNFHECALKQQTIKQQISATSLAKQRLQEQLNGLRAKQTKIQEQLRQNDSPLQPLQLQLEALLEDRVHKEQQLQDARKKLDVVESLINNLEEDFSELELNIEQYRCKLEQLRLEQNKASTKLADVVEHAATANLILEQTENLLGTESLEIWQNKLDKIIKNINKLGAVNLAAIEEFNVENERKKYLSLQQEDLTTALATLKEAILKIDTETRKQFKTTFEHVNDNFQKLFPKLFGGGSARLELDTDDWLVAGISVLAQPPGKKNSSIYLLSGGEKALTAVALIFSIFQLNPAPFCILDEVDAPLDDANVIRFSELLLDLSTQVQFIFITHNKTTMKIANQLIGVTMKEPGVSRLVSVNVDEAVAMVN